MKYPAARREHQVDTYHGVPVEDPYRWLEDRTSPETQQWIAAQDSLTKRALARTPGRDALQSEIAAMYHYDLRSIMHIRGKYRFYTERLAGQEQGHLNVLGPDGNTRTLVDPLALQPDGKLALMSYTPSPNGKYVAYTLASGGTEETTLYILDTATGARIDGPIERVRYSPFSWLPDSSGYYYGQRLDPAFLPPNESMFHRKVFFHRMGTPHTSDPMVFGQGRDKTEYYGTSISQDGRWLILSANRGTEPRNDLYIVDRHAGTPPVALQENVDAATHAVVSDDGRCYILTNDGHPRGALYIADPLHPEKSRWKLLIPERNDAVLDGYTVTKNTVIAQWQKDGISELTVHDRTTGSYLHTVSLPGAGAANTFRNAARMGDTVLLSYTDAVTPTTTYRYNTVTGERTLFKAPAQKLNLPPMTVRQIQYRSKDGTLVPMTIIARSDVKLDGSNPTILYGYGGFRRGMQPQFSPKQALWVAKGGVYAIANLRGGNERGEEWHRAGMRDKKQNVFDDFIAAAEHLIAEGYTSTSHLGIEGGSNGGLLVAAAMTQRPDLFRAVHCAVPLTDMIRYESFGMGRTWNDEYGTVTNPAEFQWLRAYSPYHHVVEGTAYPSLLVTTGDNDARTDPAHARKFTAAVQWATRGRGPVLFRREADAGHQGGSIRLYFQETADVLGYFAKQLGLSLSQHQRKGRDGADGAQGIAA